MSDLRRTIWPYKRRPTVDDLKIRRCFICHDDDASTPGRRTRAKHGFVHPCRCTLIAHETCLLHWIDSGDETRCRCAQCQEPYVVGRRRAPLALRLLDGANSVVSRIGSGVLLASVGCMMVGIVVSGYVFCAVYGYYATWWMLGGEVHNHFLHDPRQWPASAFLLIPFSAPAFFFVTATLPWPTVAYVWARRVAIWIDIGPVSPFRMDMATCWIAYRLTCIPEWPPSPWTIAMFSSLVRSFYRRRLRTLEKRLLDDAALQCQTQASRARADQNVFLADVQMDVGIDARAEDPGAPVQDRGMPHRINALDIGRPLFTMILLPPLARGVGGLLCRAAPHLPLLQGFLDMSPPFDDPPWAKGGRGDLTLRDFEPIWWHSLIGLSLVVVARDAVSLFHKVLLQREAEDDLRSIVDRPFTDVDLSSLELVI